MVRNLQFCINSIALGVSFGNLYDRCITFSSDQIGLGTPYTMSGRRGPRGTTGRILPHERDTDNSVPVLGAEFTDLGENYSHLYNETLQHDMNHRTRKDYRRRLIRIVKYWEMHCPEYYPVGTRDVFGR